MVIWNVFLNVPICKRKKYLRLWQVDHIQIGINRGQETGVSAKISGKWGEIVETLYLHSISQDSGFVYLL